MPSWQGKSKGTKIGYRIFVWTLRKFGIHPAYFLLRFVALYYFLFSVKSTRNIYHYFNKRLGYSPLASILKVYSNYYQFGQSLIDKVVVMADIRNPFTFTFDGEENLREIVKTGKGGMLLSAHIGNWEAAGHLLNRLQTKINVVMYDGEEKQIKEYLDSVTGERNLNVIIIRDQLSHIYEISDAFNKNELVCMHADRFLEGNRTIVKKFLGEDALFPMGPFILASKFKVPVSFVFAMKESSTHYHFFATPVKQYHSLQKSDVVDRMTDDFVSEMENKVKRYPLQWFNYYDFWQKEKWTA
jgi:predicted LPLAT superfamily acyltransferase